MAGSGGQGGWWGGWGGGVGWGGGGGGGWVRVGEGMKRERMGSLLPLDVKM